MKLVLERIAYLDNCTLSKLRVGPALLYALELPWRGNKPDESCIPCGYYQLAWMDSERHGLVLHVLDVPGRSFIEVHVGNFVRDSLGCILPGLSYTWSQGALAVIDSLKAMDILRALKDGPADVTELLVLNTRAGYP